MYQLLYQQGEIHAARKLEETTSKPYPTQPRQDLLYQYSTYSTLGSNSMNHERRFRNQQTGMEHTIMF